MKFFKELGKNGIKSFILLSYKLIIQIICKKFSENRYYHYFTAYKILSMYYVNNKYYSYNKSYTMSDSMLSTLNIISQREPSYAVGGNVNWCCHYRKQYRGS